MQASYHFIICTGALLPDIYCESYFPFRCRVIFLNHMETGIVFIIDIL